MEKYNEEWEEKSEMREYIENENINIILYKILEENKSIKTYNFIIMCINIIILLIILYSFENFLSIQNELKTILNPYK